MGKVKSPSKVLRDERQKKRNEIKPLMEETIDFGIGFITRCGGCGYDLSFSPHRQMCGRNGIECDKLGGTECKDCGNYIKEGETHSCAGGPYHNRCIDCGFNLDGTKYFEYCGEYVCEQKGGYFCKGKIKGGEECRNLVKDGEKTCCLF